MTLNINEIVLNKIQELDESKIIEQAIEKKIESVITDAVDKAFAWEFRLAIETKIKEQVGDIAGRIKLNSYNEMVAMTVKNILEVELNQDLAEKVQTKVRDLLLVQKSAVKFSDINQKYKLVNYDDDENYYFKVVRTEEKDRGFTHVKYSFYPSDDTDLKKWSITFLKYKNDPFTISTVTYEDETKYYYENISTLKNYDGFECLVLKSLLNKLPIEIDVDESQCEHMLCQSIDC